MQHLQPSLDQTATELSSATSVNRTSLTLATGSPTCKAKQQLFQPTHSVKTGLPQMARLYVYARVGHDQICMEPQALCKDGLVQFQQMAQRTLSLPLPQPYGLAWASVCCERWIGEKPEGWKGQHVYLWSLVDATMMDLQYTYIYIHIYIHIYIYILLYVYLLNTNHQLM